jgi:TATA-box binding protein (TBP) (component of TFIID and TFIIIB)
MHSLVNNERVKYEKENFSGLIYVVIKTIARLTLRQKSSGIIADFRA